MKKILTGIGLFIVILVLGIVYGFLEQQKSAASIPVVQIGNAVFEVEIAETPAKQAIGLSGQPGLPENKGMLFSFRNAGSYGFWMKGMRFPLDILWIAGNKVVGIEKNIPADSAASYYPPEPVDKVLEINAGLADKLGIKTGDSVLLE